METTPKAAEKKTRARRTTARELEGGGPAPASAVADDARSGRAGDDTGIPARPAPKARPVARTRRVREGVYGPDRLAPLHTQGLVATRHWIGKVNGKRVHVQMGAPKASIPEEILVEVEADGVTFDHAEPTPGSGAIVIEERPQPPRARRDPPARPTSRRFQQVRSSIVE